MTTCWHCSDTRVQPLKLTSTACPECAHIPRLEHMAMRYAAWRKLSKKEAKAAEKWLSCLFSVAEQVEIRRTLGTGVQERLL